MAFRVQVHAIISAESAEGLAQLPVEWRLFRSEQHGCMLFDHGFDRDDPSAVEQYSARPNFHRGSGWWPTTFRFDREHAYLNELARKPGMAEQMNRHAIKYALLVSALVRGRVFFTYADSHGHDAVVIAEKGRMERLRFTNGDEIISVNADGRVSSGPNIYRSEEEGTKAAGLSDDAFKKQFGYRLMGFDPFDEDADSYVLLSQSVGPIRRKSSIRSLLGMLIRGPH